MTRQLLLGFIIFLLFLPLVSAETVSIGIQPTEINILTSQTRIIRLWNEGPTDATYWVEIDDDIKDYVSCDFCYEEFNVPANGDRINDFIAKEITFNSPPEAISSGIYVYGRPASAPPQDGMLAIQPRLKINIHFNTQPTTTTTTIPSSSSSDSTWWNPFTWFPPTTTTTSTTTTTTTIIDTNTTTTTLDPYWDDWINPPTTTTTKPNIIKQAMEWNTTQKAIAGLGIVILILIIYYLYIMNK